MFNKVGHCREVPRYRLRCHILVYISFYALPFRTRIGAVELIVRKYSLLWWSFCVLKGTCDTLPEVESRTQGSRPRSRPRSQKISRPRTDPLEAKAKDQGHRRKCSPKKKGLQNFFSGEKGLQKFFFRRSLLEETKKRSLQIFRKVSGVFQRNFKGSKVVLSSSRGQSNFRGLEASRPRPRTSKCVLEDSTSAFYSLI